MGRSGYARGMVDKIIMLLAGGLLGVVAAIFWGPPELAIALGAVLLAIWLFVLLPLLLLEEADKRG